MSKKITLSQSEQTELTPREERIWDDGYVEGFKMALFYVAVLIIVGLIAIMISPNW
jgi:hypothetical protein